MQLNLIKNSDAILQLPARKGILRQLTGIYQIKSGQKTLLFEVNKDYYKKQY